MRSDEKMTWHRDIGSHFDYIKRYMWRRCAKLKSIEAVFAKVQFEFEVPFVSVCLQAIIKLLERVQQI